MGGTEVGNPAYVKGEVTVLRHSETSPKQLSMKDPIYLMDTLETGEGELKVLFHDETVLSLAPQSKVVITEYVYRPDQGERRSIYDILKGRVRAVVDQALSLKTNDVTLQTPTSVAGIRGTDVGIIVSASSTQFLCFEGRFEAYFKDNPAGRVLVGPGQFTEISGPIPSQPAPIPQALRDQFLTQPETPPQEARPEEAKPAPMIAQDTKKETPAAQAQPIRVSKKAVFVGEVEYLNKEGALTLGKKGQAARFKVTLSKPGKIMVRVNNQEFKRKIKNAQAELSLSLSDMEIKKAGTYVAIFVDEAGNETAPSPIKVERRSKKNR